MAKAVQLKDKSGNKCYAAPYWPIGSIYLSVNTTNPSKYFGGTWEIVGSGAYLMAYSSSNTWFDKPGTTGGSNGKSGSWSTDNTTLTVDQIPSHNHTQAAHSHRMANTNADVGWRGTTGYANTNGAWATGYVFENNGNGGYTNSQTPTINKTGGGKGHNHFHVSPYYTVVVWKRTK
ncbi:MAG: phage baseplate protein [Romboutsia timonensis]